MGKKSGRAASSVADSNKDPARKGLGYAAASGDDALGLSVRTLRRSRAYQKESLSNRAYHRSKTEPMKKIIPQNTSAGVVLTMGAT